MCEVATEKIPAVGERQVNSIRQTLVLGCDSPLLGQWDKFSRTREFPGSPGLGSFTAGA